MMVVVPGRILPDLSAASIIENPIRSLTLRIGLNDSSLTSNSAEPGEGIRFSRTRGVCPTASKTLLQIFGLIDKPPPRE
jgi:hypothetical protein